MNIAAAVRFLACYMIFELFINSRRIATIKGIKEPVIAP